MQPGKSIHKIILEMQDITHGHKDSASDLKSSFNVQFRDSVDEEE